MSDDFRACYAAAQRGEPEASESLLAPFIPRIERFVKRQLGAPPRPGKDPDDIVQSTLLSLLAHLPQWPADLREDEFLARVIQTARWRMLDAVSARVDRGESALSEGAHTSPQASAGPVTRADERAWTRKQIQTLPEAHRVVLEAFYVEGLSISAIAERLGLLGDAVKQRLHRGRKSLESRWGHRP